MGRKKKGKGIDAAVKLPAGNFHFTQSLLSPSADSVNSNSKESKTTYSWNSKSSNSIVKSKASKTKKKTYTSITTQE